VKSTAIQDACRLVSGLISDPAARLSIAIETGPDEAFLIGTSDGYLRLALATLEFIADAQAGRANRIAINGLVVADTSSFGEVITPGEVRLAAGWLTASKSESLGLTEYIQRLSPGS
jgi:hypothetical protein